MTDLTADLRLAALAAAGWSDVSDRIGAGLCHDLNGRVTSLAGMVQLLQIDEDSSSMSPFLEEEVSRLERSVRLLRTLAGEPNEDVEPIHLSELLPDLVTLFRKHRHLEHLDTTVAVTEGLPPVQGRWTFLGRVVLTQLSIAGREAANRSRQLRLEVDRAEAPGRLRITAIADGEPGDASQLPPGAGRPDGMPRLAELVGGVWSTELSEDRALFELELPDAKHAG